MIRIHLTCFTLLSLTPGTSEPILRKLNSLLLGKQHTLVILLLEIRLAFHILYPLIAFLVGTSNSELTRYLLEALLV